MGYTVAVVGATGAVGTRMIQQLEQSTLPIDKVRLLFIFTFCWKSIEV